METVSRVVKVTLPNYLSHLPVPDHIGGIFKLSVGEWASLLPFIGTVSFFSWLTYTWFSQRRNSGRINPRIQKDCPKVVHGFDIEDLGEKMAFCRCWRSAKFPYCDGTHNDFNKATGDNVGPLCIKRR